MEGFFSCEGGKKVMAICSRQLSIVRQGKDVVGHSRMKNIQGELMTDERRESSGWHCLSL